MDRRHAIRCVMAAVAAGGRTCSNAQATVLLREHHNITGNTLCVIRDGPIRPIYRDDACYYIPFRHERETKEVCVGPWVDLVMKEEQIIVGKRNYSIVSDVEGEAGERECRAHAV